MHYHLNSKISKSTSKHSVEMYRAKDSVDKVETGERSTSASLLGLVARYRTHQMIRVFRLSVPITTYK